MKKLVRISTIYALLGTVAVVFYLIFTKQHHYEGQTLLSSLYLFLFGLGTVFHLLIAILDKLFNFTNHKLYSPFLIVHNVGMFVSSLVMLGKGINSVTGAEKSVLLSAFTGIGHLIIAIAGISFFVILNQIVDKNA